MAVPICISILIQRWRNFKRRLTLVSFTEWFPFWIRLFNIWMSCLLRVFFVAVADLWDNLWFVARWSTFSVLVSCHFIHLWERTSLRLHSFTININWFGCKMGGWGKQLFTISILTMNLSKCYIVLGTVFFQDLFLRMKSIFTTKPLSNVNPYNDLKYLENYTPQLFLYSNADKLVLPGVRTFYSFDLVFLLTFILNWISWDFLFAFISGCWIVCLFPTKYGRTSGNCLLLWCRACEIVHKIPTKVHSMRVYVHQQLFNEHSNSSRSQQKFQLGQSFIVSHLFNKFFSDSVCFTQHS